MRHLQAGLVDDLAAVQDQVQVEGTRRAHAAPITPPLQLEILQGLEQGPRGQTGLADHDGIQVVRLWGGNVDGRRFDDR